MNRNELKELAETCAEYRKSIGVSQSQVALDLGVSPKAISHFEKGRSSNALFLLWYIENGMGVEEWLERHGMTHGRVEHRKSC